jgi:hypothetical protein
VELYGKEWTRRDLEARLGRIEQIGGLQRTQFTEGRETGVEQILVRTGAGLSYSILPSRGMDIGLAEFAGVPLSWLSPNGEVHPAYFDEKGMGWLRSAAGGLMMTCGLSQVGMPGIDSGEELGLHGRAHHTPARHVCAEGHWEEDEYITVAQGKVEETSIFGSNLVLTRQIQSQLGKNEIIIHDVVENAGFDVAPHMLLYHFNFGFPLLEERTKINFPLGIVIPRESNMSLEGLENWSSPQANYRERVYYRENLSTGMDRMAAVTIYNPHFPVTGRPLCVRLAWDTRNLPILVQWKLPAEGLHVLGVEPANCHLEGRSAERERGSLVMLAPGQTIEYNLKLSMSDG